MTYYALKETPAGNLLLIGDRKNVTGIHWEVFERTPKVRTNWIENKKVFSHVSRQLDEYFAKKRIVFDFAHTASGTPFQKSVWRQIEKIPFGTHISYADIAKKIGNPKAVRAVGTAVGSNPLSIVIPCHRVLNSNKKLGGFAGGIKSKKVLLKNEGIAWKD